MKRKNFWMLAPVCGLGAMVLRWRMFALCVDERGLLVPGSPLEWTLLAVSAVAAAGLYFAKDPALKGNNALLAGANFLLALGLALPQPAVARMGALLRTGRGISTAALLWPLFQVSRWVSVAALLVLGVFRLRGKKPPFGLNAAVCVGFMLRMVAHYQLWSYIPQMQNYVFALLSLVLLTAFSYQQTARESGLGTSLWRLRFGLWGCFACLAAGVGSEVQPLYLCAGVWLLVCTLLDPKEA